MNSDANTRRKDTRSEISGCALRLFAERGYAAVSMRDIAEAVGVRQGAIYNHFASKQELLAELMTSHLEAVLRAHEAALAGVTGPVARLEAFARFHVGYHLDYPADVFIAYMELRSLEPEGFRRINAMRSRYEGALRAILAEGAAAGLFSIGDPAVHARALLAMLTGVTVWYREGGRLDRATIIEDYVRATLQSVGLRMPRGGDKECSTQP